LSITALAAGSELPPLAISDLRATLNGNGDRAQLDWQSGIGESALAAAPSR
ncbi:MAG: hypothetical protein IPO61_00210, partial [Gammaproteobacteria bacterium]|nr:hypothetical protein [Gammaproteobacteria bacterium]